jgi:hypothetical protein
MNLSETLRDPKQRIMAGVAGFALLIAALVVGRSLLGGGGGPKPSEEVTAAVENLQNQAPPEPTQEQIEKEAQADGDPVDMTPSSGKRLQKPK